MWIYCSPIRTLTTLLRERKIFVNSTLMHPIRVSNEWKIRVTAEGVTRKGGQLSSSAVKQMRILMSVAPTGKHTNTHTHTSAQKYESRSAQCTPFCLSLSLSFSYSLSLSLTASFSVMLLQFAHFFLPPSLSIFCSSLCTDSASLFNL